MWKDKIKNLFAHRQLPPSPDLWTRLEQQLAAETRKAAPVPTKKYVGTTMPLPPLSY